MKIYQKKSLLELVILNTLTTFVTRSKSAMAKRIKFDVRGVASRPVGSKRTCGKYKMLRPGLLGATVTKTRCGAVRLAHLLWEQGAAGSNPATSTTFKHVSLFEVRAFLYTMFLWRISLSGRSYLKLVYGVGFCSQSTRRALWNRWAALFLFSFEEIFSTGCLEKSYWLV